MKRMRVVFLGVVCLISSYAFAQPSYFKISSGEIVKFAWDETTELNGREGLVIGYTVYITKDKKFCASKDKIDEIECLRTKPTIDQKIEISFGFSPGDIYYVGVSSAFFNDKNLTSKASRDTEISWSDKEYCTNGNPFVVKVEKKDTP